MRTLVELFEESVKKYPNRILLKEKTDGVYREYSYSTIHNEVIQFGAGLVSLGIEKKDRIGLIAEGRKDWLVSELGMFYAGAINVPLSIKLDAKTEIGFRLKHSGARMVIVSGTQSEKINLIINDHPEIEKIILLDNIKELPPRSIGFKEIKNRGAEFLINEENSKAFDQIWQNVQPDDLANISYTSGTTADPKGIMLTQLNYTANVIQGNTLMPILAEYTTLTILPWDHSFAHTACLYSFIVNGACIACQEIGKNQMETLRNIPKNINETKPDLMMSVPAISKSFRKNIESGIHGKGKIATALFNQGLRVAYRYNGNGYNKGKGFRIFLKPLYKLYDAILFEKIRANFGGKLKFFIGGGALLDIELQRFFAAIGIPVMQGYGLSEASPIISSNALHAVKFGSSGKVAKYLDLKICDTDGNDLPIGQKGEIVIKGDNVMKGYWNNEKSTSETIKDGWLHTGDMGYMDSEGFLFVLGRFKSLLIGNDGEKFSPEGIEESLVDQSPFIDQCMLYNNQNPYTTGMIVPNIASINRVIKEKGFVPGSNEGNHESIKLIQKEIDEYKQGGKYQGMFPERWLPVAFVILPETFNEQNQLINSTMKMVRGKITTHFCNELAFLYTSEAKNCINKTNETALVKLNQSTKI